MERMSRMIRLDSGRWYVRLERDASGLEFLYLTRPDRPAESMRVHLPFSWRGLDDDALLELARRPELRIWSDDLGIQWRVAAVGPGTRYPFPVPGRYLVFDSEQAWAGIARYADERELGDLTDAELLALRDSISDLGGGRRSFRRPERPIAADREAGPASS